MEMKDCIADDRLNIYMDGELAREEQAIVEAHLDQCSECRTRLENMHLLGEGLRAESLRAVEAADFSGVWERVRSETFPAGPALEPRRSWIEEMRVGMKNLFSPTLTAAAVILMVVVVYYSAGLKPPPPSPPSVMEAAVSNETQIITLETDSPSVMVLQSPESGATIIVISDNSTETSEGPAT